MFFGSSGPLSDMVTYGGYAISAASAIRLGWLPRKGSRWLPGTDDVPVAVAALITPCVAIVLVLMFVFLRGPQHLVLLGIVTVIFMIVGVGSAVQLYYLLQKNGHEVSYKNWWGTKKTKIVLGGKIRTPDAQKDKEAGRTDAALMELAQGNVTLVFTADSIAQSRRLALIYFLAFQILGSLAIAEAGLLLAAAFSVPPPHTP